MFKKQWILSSFFLFLAGGMSAYADTPTALKTNASSEATPESPASWEMGITALWLKPGASNLNYAILNKALPILTPNWYEEELQPGYSPGFELSVRYVAPDSEGEDLQASWTHFKSSTSSSVRADGVNYFVGPDYEIGPDAAVIREADGKADFNYDVVNVDVGQSMNASKHVHVRFFAGLSTGFLREEVQATYSGIDTDLHAFSMYQQVQSNFTGIGPRVGLNFDYATRSNFSFTGEAAVSALIGTLSSKTSYIGNSFVTTDNHQTISDQNVHQVVPGFDAKLGVNYQHAFSPDTVFTLSAGYQAAVYINAISQYIPESLVSDEGLETGSIYVATLSHTLSNYSVQGPYLKFGLQF